MDAIQALLDAANYLESRSCAVVLPRDAIDNAECQASFIPIPQLQQLANRVSSSPVNPASPSGDHDDQAERRSGGAGTREVHNKLEKHRRAHLRECFGSLNNLLPSRENRRQSNHSILLGTISHIKELERTYTLFCKEREKEKFQQRSLQNKLNHILNVPDSLENLRQANVSSPSTDTASDVSDEGDVLHGANDSCKTTGALFNPDSVPTQCPDVTSTAHPSSTFLLCPVLDQKIPHGVQGTVFIQAPISFTQPFTPTDSAAGALTSATSAALSGLLPASLVSANPVSPVSKLLPSTQSNPQSSGQLKNLGQRPMVAWISSEVVPATSQPGSNPRMAVQMLQQTLAQRAMEQQKKQNQMLGQSQPTAQVSEKGSSASKTTKLLQPATIAPQSHNPVAFFSSLSTPSSLSSMPAYKMSSLSSSNALAVNESHLYPEVRVMATIPQLVVSTASLHGTSFAPGTSPIFSSLQLLSSNQISSLQARSANDLAQFGIQQTSIPLIQFVNSVSVGPSNIPILSSDSSYRQQVVASVVSTPVMMSSTEHPSNQAMIIAAENILPVSCPSTQS